MLNNEKNYALLYVTVILIFYIIGLIVLLLHYVWKKNGQISFFDIYLELLQLVPMRSENHTGFNEQNEIISNHRNPPKTSTCISHLHRESPGMFLTSDFYSPKRIFTYNMPFTLNFVDNEIKR